MYLKRNWLLQTNPNQPGHILVIDTFNANPIFHEGKYLLLQSATYTEICVFSHLQTVEKLRETLDTLCHLQNTMLLNGGTLMLIYP